MEAVRDRVGIVHAGRLVDEGTLADLRLLSAQTVEVTIDGHVAQLPSLPGVDGARLASIWEHTRGRDGYAAAGQDA